MSEVNEKQGVRDENLSTPRFNGSAEKSSEAPFQSPNERFALRRETLQTLVGGGAKNAGVRFKIAIISGGAGGGVAW